MKRWQEHIVSIFFNIFTCFAYQIEASVHRSQNKQYYVRGHKKATYEEFKTAFLKEKWIYKLSWPNSLFHDKEYDKNMIHAGIIRINDVCYNMTSYGYMRAMMLVKKKINNFRFLDE